MLLLLAVQSQMLLVQHAACCMLGQVYARQASQIQRCDNLGRELVESTSHCSAVSDSFSLPQE
jgi:hypothetical protein